MKNYSVWLDGIDNGNYPKLNENLNVDVLIIGGGITGISTAYHMLKSKLKVAVVERNEIGMGVTSRTTGKLTYLQGNIYSKLTRMYSCEVAKKYYESQKYAIKLVGNIISKNKIDCNYKRQKSYLFASTKEELEKLKKEKNLLNKMGAIVEEKNIPINVRNYYSISVNDTAYFHPLKYINALAKLCVQNKIPIYEKTNVIKIKRNNDYFECFTETNKIIAKKVVFASHYPYFLKPFLFPLRGSLEKSYISASLSNKHYNISGINLSKESISFRYHDDYFLYLNGSHNLAFKYNNKDNFNNLLSSNTINADFKYIWSNTDIITNDYLPYIGEISKDVYIATGYNTWGMTNGSLAGLLLKDIILNKENKYKCLFNPKRSKSFYSYLNAFSNIFYSFKPFIENKIIKNKSYYPKNVIFTKRNGKNVAIYIDESKKEHIVLNTCPHLKCSLVFNEVENTWDCPCHSSRFTIDGKCIMGPSKKDITYKD